MQVQGNRDVEPEELLAYELGMWAEPINDLYLSLTGFISDYQNLFSREPGDPILSEDSSGMPYVLLPLNYENKLTGVFSGVEFAVDWKVSDSFSLAATYAYLHVDMDQGDSQDLSVKDDWESSPENIATLRGHFSFFPETETDVIFRYVDRISDSDIDSYIESDIRLAWEPGQTWEVALILRNLIESSHQEYGFDVIQTPLSEVERSAFLQTTYTF